MLKPTVKIDDYTYYRTKEACRLAGISNATFFRWVQTGLIEDVTRRDRNGWRLFTTEDVDNLKKVNSTTFIK